jgi:hypothetical protein
MVNRYLFSNGYQIRDIKYWSLIAVSSMAESRIHQ